MPDLLIELFSEEIPARMQNRAAADLQKLMTEGITSAGLSFAGAASFATPRRLALHVANLLPESPRTSEERRGPRTDAPDKAIEGFLRSTGLSRTDLETRDDKKGEIFVAKIVTEGRPAEAIVADVLEGVIRNFPWPKSMRWGTGSLRWVRPLHSVIATLSDETGTRVIPFEIDGIRAGDTTHGHRFMAPDAIRVTDFDGYEAALHAAKVVLRSETRAETIKADAEQAAFAQGLEIVDDPGLLAEVSGLVEWPVVLMGDIGADFLDLPPEVLQTSMKEHQKFFSVRNPKTGRIEKYVTVANRETADGGAEITAGNGKVLTARLGDAKFFWENDLRVVDGKGEAGLLEMAAPLENVTFHNRLGSVAEQVERMVALSETIAPMIGANPADAGQAARIAKADLASEMIYEFPELQGVMGRYYAKAAGLSDAIADAADAHYAPLGPSDAVPVGAVSGAVALAAKIDVLTGFWTIDETPTGSKDPFALRRAALGVIRIILEHGYRLDLKALIGTAFDGQSATVRAGFAGDVPVPDALMQFFTERMKVYLKDQGLRHDAMDAAFDKGDADLVRLVARVTALQAFLETEDGENLVQGFKRAVNILSAEEKKDGVEYSLDPDPKLAETDAERGLFAALDVAEPEIGKAVDAEDFAGAMTALAGLRAPIDAYFEDTLINAEVAMIRRNRLCLLNRIRTVMADVAAFERIAG